MTTIAEDKIKEQWKPIDEFPIYSVSNQGRVRNDKRNYILQGGYDRDGYRQVTISYNGKQYNRRICRLVALAFIPNPNSLQQVNHKDENKENDCVHNLEWCTAQYNNNYGHRTSKTRRSIQCIETKEIFEGIRLAARHINISHSTIRIACKNSNKTAGGYHWKYV